MKVKKMNEDRLGNKIITFSSVVSVFDCNFVGESAFARVIGLSDAVTKMDAKGVVAKKVQEYLDSGASFGDSDYETKQMVQDSLEIKDVGRLKLVQAVPEIQLSYALKILNEDNNRTYVIWFIV